MDDSDDMTVEALISRSEGLAATAPWTEVAAEGERPGEAHRRARGGAREGTRGPEAGALDLCAMGEVLVRQKVSEAWRELADLLT